MNTKTTSDFFKESARIYKNYLESEKVSKAEISVYQQNANGKFSKGFIQNELNRIRSENRSKIAGAKKSMEKLEAEFEQIAYEEADLEGKSLSKNLISALNSGIDYTPKELLYLARKHAGSEADSRLIRDFSRKRGYALNNYISPEEKIESFKNFNKALVASIDDTTDYIKTMMGIAQRQENRIAKKSLNDTIELLILVELDRAEREREIIVQRIRDGLKASNKKAGRKPGQLDKLTDELQADIVLYLADRSIKAVDLMKKHNISRNTLKKYVEYVKKNM